jgi:hypothetical protein
MPAFYLTPTQRRAMDALEWLYTLGQDQRRTGRTRVLVLNYLRRMAIGGGVGRDGWVDVEDHYNGHESSHRLAEMVRDLGGQIGMDVEITRGPRARLVSPVTRQIVEALTDFGEIPDDSLGLDQNVASDLFVARAPVSPRRVETPEKPPQRSLWEQLRDDI